MIIHDRIDWEMIGWLVEIRDIAFQLLRERGTRYQHWYEVPYETQQEYITKAVGYWPYRGYAK